MTTPTAGRFEFGDQGIADAFEQRFEKGQGQTRTGGAIGGAREGHTGQARQGRACGIAMKNLQKEYLDGGHGIEDAITPGMAEIETNGRDAFSGKSGADIGLELTDDLRDIKGHPWPPVGMSG